jgi:colanic acid/amylovoran biosynthesis glycosyltransferase
MKIGFIVSSFPSLSQTFILNQITGLLDLGHDVEIFARNNPNELIICLTFLTVY